MSRLRLQTDTMDTEYSEQVRRNRRHSPARLTTLNPDYLFRKEASGSAGKLMVFAVRTRTFPKEVTDATTFYVGTNSPAELEALRRAILTSDMPLPISGEYMGRRAFDLAEKYGKDTFVSIEARR